MAESTNPDMKIIKTSGDSKWVMLSYEDNYLFANTEGEKPELLKTPGRNLVRTCYPQLADRILTDLEKFGYNYRSAESILSWHFTMIDSFCDMDHQKVETILAGSFLYGKDWTLSKNQDNEIWTDVYGTSYDRESTIREWLSNCTKMQMTAACCIGNAYESINVAFVLARIMENFTGVQRKNEFRKIADDVRFNFMGPFGDTEEILADFGTFELYYGIHLEEEGPCINEVMKREDETVPDFDKTVTTEMLVGRNYYLYIDGVKSEEQPLTLELSDLALDLDDEEDTDEDLDEVPDEDEPEEEEEEQDNGEDLSEYLPEKWWVKRISAVEDGREAYYIIGLTVDGNDHIRGITMLREVVHRDGFGWYMIPRVEMESSSTYEELDSIPDEVAKEIELLTEGRYLSEHFSFIGKRLPQAMVESHERSYALQSAYRLAYMHMDIETDENELIEDLHYSSYQSSGSSYGDMFSRPVCYSDRKDEAVDMLLHILDRYTDEEYRALCPGD